MTLVYISSNEHLNFFFFLRDNIDGNDEDEVGSLPSDEEGMSFWLFEMHSFFFN